MHAESSSPTRDWTRAPGIGSVESYPLDHQGGPCKGILEVNIVQLEEVCVIPLVGSKEDGFPLSVHWASPKRQLFSSVFQGIIQYPGRN